MICYILSALLWLIYLWLDSMVICYAFEPKKESVGRGVMTLGLMAAQLPVAVIKFLYNDVPVIRTGAIFVVAVIMVIYAAFLLQGSLWQKIGFVLAEYVLAMSAEMVSAGILSSRLTDEIGLSMGTPSMVLVMMVVCLVTAVFFQILVIVWKKLIRREPQDMSVIITFCVFPVSQIFMMLAINEQIFEEVTPHTGLILMAMAAGALADGMLLYTLLRQQQMQELQLHLQELQNTWEIATNHYNEIEARREGLAKIRHDMRNQLIVLQGLLRQEEYAQAERMLATLTEAVDGTTEYVYCGDPVVNAIMEETERACKERGVELKYDLEIPGKLKMNPVVICSILSNMTRNAVAAAAETVEKGRAFVEIRAAVRGDYLHICVENSRTLEPPKQTGRRGYGLEILRELVERGHGQIDVKPEEGSFRVEITVENF